MLVESKLKVIENSVGVHRYATLTDTYSKILKPSILERLGITRVGVTTGLDRLGIPTVTAIAPDSICPISVFSGKGSTLIASKLSAIMECVERISATNRPENIVVASENKLQKDGILYCSPTIFTESIKPDYSLDKEIEWTVGHNLIDEQDYLVPLNLVIIPYRSPSDSIYQPYRFTHTNGLASGTCMEEAIAHALCEVIERDAVSIAELTTSILPFAKVKQLESFLKQFGENDFAVDPSKFADDFQKYKSVDLRTIPNEAKELLSKFESQKIKVSIKFIDSDVGVPTFGCACFETIDTEKALFTAGYGTHPDATTALLRAITELAQSRVTDIQGAREDVYSLDKKRTATMIPVHWLYTPSDDQIAFDSIESHFYKDILDDINLMTHRLYHVGLNFVIAVPLKSILDETYVVRMLVPGIETWHPTSGDSNIGPRAARIAKRMNLLD